MSMKSLPSNVKAYKRTNIFSELTIPKGLLSEHRTLKDVWGKIVILEGRLRYCISGDDGEEVELDENNYGVVEPERIHSVAPIGKVKFYVEFYR